MKQDAGKIIIIVAASRDFPPQSMHKDRLSAEVLEMHDSAEGLAQLAPREYTFKPVCIAFRL